MRLLIASFCLIFLFFSTGVSAKIVFESELDGVRGIYVMDDDGSNLTLLTDVLNPSSPRWSPDGRQIVFYRQVNPNDLLINHIFIMNADGSNIRQLTPPDNLDDWDPSFSPDGTSIVFNQDVRRNNKSTSFICVMDLATGAIEHIAELGANWPVWSPDGKKIVFTPFSILGRTGSNLWMMDADGHKPHELLPPLPKQPLIDRVYPRWASAPNGDQQILYLQSEKTFEVIDGVGRFIPQAYKYFIYDINRGTSRRLAFIPKNYRCAGLAWMDNGNSVLLSTYKVQLKEPVKGLLHPYNLYKYHIATGKFTRLTEHPGSDSFPDWIDDKALSVSPEGKLPTPWGQLKSLLPAYRNAFKAVWRNVTASLRVPVTALYRSRGFRPSFLYHFY